MATHTLVTRANLTAVTYSQAPATLLPADLATIVNGILQDPNISNGQNMGRALVPGSFGYNGLLMCPGRGVLRLWPGDVVAIDNNGTTNVGWPILVSADAIANGSWTFT